MARAAGTTFRGEVGAALAYVRESPTLWRVARLVSRKRGWWAFPSRDYTQRAGDPLMHVQRGQPHDEEKAPQPKWLQGLLLTQSGRRDLNPRPPEPHAGEGIHLK